MGERPAEPASGSRSGRSFLRDVAVGAALGVALAVVWVVVLLLTRPAERAMVNFRTRRVEYGEVGATYHTAPFSDFSWRNLGLGCLVLLAFGVSVVGGFVVGGLVGGPPGSAVGGVVGYLAPFVGYGVYVQRTVGWAAWLGIETGGRGTPPRPPK